MASPICFQRVDAEIGSSGNRATRVLYAFGPGAGMKNVQTVKLGMELAGSERDASEKPSKILMVAQ